MLNDHWDDMRAEGFISNRLYDALACGAFVISDHIDGIEAEFDDAVVTYESPAELEALIDRYLADPDERRRRGDRGRAAVLERHTFDARARTPDGDGRAPIRTPVAGVSGSASGREAGRPGHGAPSRSGGELGGEGELRVPR